MDMESWQKFVGRNVKNPDPEDLALIYPPKEWPINPQRGFVMPVI